MIQIVNRIFSLLSILNELGPLPLRDVARLAKLRKTTCHNILKSLTEIKMVELASPGCYRLGPGLSLLASSPLSDDFLTKKSSMYMEQLARQTGEAVVLTVLRGTIVHVVCATEGEHDVVVRSRAHEAGAVYRWATGRLLLAHRQSRCGIGELVDLFGLPSEEDWPEVGADAAKLALELERIRAMDILELHSNMRGVVLLASPVRDAVGRVLAALGMPIPAYRAEGRLSEYRTQLCRVSGDIGRAICGVDKLRA